MKIRYKLLITGITVSTVLLFSMLFMIRTAALLIDYYNLKIAAESVRNNVQLMKYQILDLVSTEKRASEVIADFTMRKNVLSFSMQDIITGRNFNPLNTDDNNVQELLNKVSVKWEENKKLLFANQIEDYLSYRKRKEPGKYFSLLATKASLEKQIPNIDNVLLTKIYSVIGFMVLIENEYAAFDRLVYSTFNEFISIVDEFKATRFLQVNVILVSVLLVSLIIILIFSILTGRRVSILEKTLNVISSGNLSLRVPIMGKDEFGSLGKSVNSFVNTLQGRINSFQTLMGQVGRTIDETIDSEKVESVLLKLAIHETSADGAGLYLVNGEEGILYLSRFEGNLMPVFPLAELPDDPSREDIVAMMHSRWINKGKTLVGECAAEGKTIICSDVSNSDYSWKRDVASLLYVSSFILLPLQVGKSILGVLLLTSSNPEELFTPLDYLNMQSYAGLVAVTLDNIYRYKQILETTQLDMEIDIASDIQDKLIPQQLPRLPEGVASYMCRRVKGMNGDYFDIRDLGQGKCIIILCELTGRGVPAGLLMAMLRALIILVMSPEKEASAIMNEINEKMFHGLSMENYASVGTLIIDSDGYFSFSSASHCPLYIFRKNESKYESIKTTGLPIGIDPETHYEQKKGQLHPQDMVLMCTDGITDSLNQAGSPLGSAGMLSAIKSFSDNSPEKITELFQNFLLEYEGGQSQQDDQTLLLYKHGNGEQS